MMTESRRPAPLMDPAEDGCDDAAVSHTGSTGAEPQSTASQGARRRITLWSQLHEAAKSPRAFDDSSVVECDVDTDDEHPPPLWTRLRRPESTDHLASSTQSYPVTQLRHERSSSREGDHSRHVSSGMCVEGAAAAAFSCIRTPTAGRPGCCDVLVQSGFCPPEVYVQGTRDLMRMVEQETEEEIACLEEMVEGLQVERDQLRAELDCATCCCAERAEHLERLHIENATLRAQLAESHQKSSLAPRAVLPDPNDVSADIAQLASILDARLEKHAEALLAAAAGGPAAVALATTNEALRAEIVALRGETKRQRQEILCLTAALARHEQGVAKIVHSSQASRGGLSATDAM